MTKNYIKIARMVIIDILEKIPMIAHGNNILYTSFPKSASIHTLNLLKIANKDMKIIRAKFSGGVGHNFISSETLNTSISNIFKDTVIYGHFPFNQHNHSLMKLKNINSVLVLVRSLPDIVISYKDHIDQNNFGPLDYRIEGLKESNPNWFQLEDKKKYDYIIKFIIPWYVRYIVSWVKASENYSVKFITYEESTLYPKKSILSLGKFLNIHNIEDFLPKKVIVNKKESNFNVGQNGRGFKYLSLEQLEEIKDLFHYFGSSITDLNIVKYLIYGFAGLDFTVKDVVENFDNNKVDYFSIPRRS